MLRRFIFIAILLIFANPAWSATYYVATSGSDSNPGNQTLPFRTIQKAANTVAAGDTVLVRGGSYTEAINIQTSGTSSNIITFKPEPGTGTVNINNGLGSQSDNSAIDIVNKSYNRIEGFNFTNSTWGWVIKVYNTQAIHNVSNLTQGNQIVNNTFTNNGNYEISSPNYVDATIRVENAGPNNIIEGNSFSGNYGRNIMCWQCFDNIFRKNTVTNSRPRKISFDNNRDYAISIWFGGDRDGSGSAASGNIFERNVVSGSLAGPRSYHSMGFWCDVGGINNTVRYNEVTGLTTSPSFGQAFAYYIESRCNGSIVEFNIARNSGSGFVSTFFTTGATNVQFRNNVSYNNNFWGFALDRGTNTIRDNIAYNNNSGQILCADECPGNNTYSYNDWFSSSTSNVSRYNSGTYSDSANQTFSSWQSSNGSSSSNEVSVNPQFVNVSSLDFNLNSGSALIGTGFFRDKGLHQSPKFLSASVNPSNTNQIFLNFDVYNVFEPISACDITKFTIKYGGVTKTISSSVISNQETCTLNMSESVTAGTTVTAEFSYAAIVDSAQIGNQYNSKSRASTSSEHNCPSGVCAVSTTGIAGGKYASHNGGGTACTLNSPCSITTAQSQSSSGDTVFLVDGTYGWWDTTKSGLTFKAVNKHLAYIRNGGSHVGGVYTVGVRHANTTLDGLRMSGDFTGGANHGVVRYLAGANNGVIRNCLIENSSGELVNFGGSIGSSNLTGLLMEDNLLRGAGYNNDTGEGIYLGEFTGANTATSIIIRRNIIQDFGDNAIDCKPGCSGLEVYHNIIEDQKTNNGAASTTDGSIVVQGTNVNIHHNIIRDNDLTGEGGSSVIRIPFNGTIFDNNVLHNNDHNGNLIRDRAGGSGSQTVISNNVFCSNSNNTIASGFSESGNTTPSQSGCDAKEAEILALMGGGAPPSGDITLGLLAYWTMDNTLVDQRNNAHLTYVGGSPSYVTGQIGNALDFNGQTYATTGTHAISFVELFPISGNPFSVALWWKSTATGTLIASAVDNASSRDFQLAYTSGRLDLYLRGTVTSSSASYGNGAWHHTVVTWDGTVAKWYIDAAAINNNVPVGSEPEETSEPILLGARSGGSGFRLTGALDDARFYNRALTAAEVTSLFQFSPGAAPGTPTSLNATAANQFQINLSWTASSGALFYHIESCIGAACDGIDFVEVGQTGGTTFQHLILIPNTLYRYRVRARNTEGTFSASYSNIAEATTLSGTNPSTPSNLTVTPITSSQLELNWVESVDDGFVIAYHIERCKGNGCIDFVEIDTSTSPQYVDSNLISNTLYQYRIRSEDNGFNLSSYSSTVQGTTLRAGNSSVLKLGNTSFGTFR